MHTATYLARSQFEIEVEGRPGSVDDLLPDWQQHDRFGIIVDRPLGLIGASMLIQAVSLLFYEANEDRRWTLMRYPELYAFVLDTPKGVLDIFDFFPARKEIVLPSDPQALMGAINDRAITRLAVVDGPPNHREFMFDERHACLDRITSAYAYDPDGRVGGADVIVRGTDELEWNVEMAVDSEAYIDKILNMTEEEIREWEPQLLDPRFPFSDEGRRGYAEYVRSRSSEVSAQDRHRIGAVRRQLRVDGRPEEHYRRISVDDALIRLVPASG